jgi:hypothetical protein
MNAEKFNSEMDDEIRSKGVVSASVLDRFDVAYDQDSASSAHWLVGKLRILKSVVESGRGIKIVNDENLVLAHPRDFIEWVHKRYPDVYEDVADDQE